MCRSENGGAAPLFLILDYTTRARNIATVEFCIIERFRSAEQNSAAPFAGSPPERQYVK
jgi:hypothetical protein